MKRFFEEQPAFPKDLPNGHIRQQKVSNILKRVIYAGYVEHEPWGVTRRKGHHEAIISLETFHQIEDRKNKKAFAPKRTDIHEDFPLRGAVVCACCDMPMTSCWSRSGTGKRYPYFWCQTRDCSEYRKNIRAENVEAGFQQVLRAITPTESVLSVAMSMLSDASSQRDDQTKQAKTALKRQITELGKKQDALVERLIETSNPKVIAALEIKTAMLDEDKLRLSDKIEQNTKPKASMGQIFELLREFLSNPWVIYDKGGFGSEENHP